jgi:hypothetical protein
VPEGHCPVTDTLFKQLLIKLLDGKPDESSHPAGCQYPYSNVTSALTAHFFHQPVKPPVPSMAQWLTGPTKFKFNSYTLKIVKSMFPTAEAEHFLQDLIPKAIEIANPNKTRKMDAWLHEGLPFHQFVELKEALVLRS